MITGILLFIAIVDMPYGYYQLLRFFVCGVGAYGAYLSYEQKKTVWIWILGIIAVLFNPFMKFYLSSEMWKLVDFIGGILFIVYFSKDGKIRLLKEGVNMNASKKVLRILLKDKKIKNIFLVGLLIIGAAIIFSSRKTDYYNKDHFFSYSSPSGFGNGSNQIIITYQNWKIISNDKTSDLILWEATFKNNSNQRRKLFVSAEFQDSSFMKIEDGGSSDDSGRTINPDEYGTFSGKRIIPKNISKRIIFMNIAISSQYKTTNEYGWEIWKYDEL